MTFGVLACGCDTTAQEVPLIQEILSAVAVTVLLVGLGAGLVIPRVRRMRAWWRARRATRAVHLDRTDQGVPVPVPAGQPDVRSDPGRTGPGADVGARRFVPAPILHDGPRPEHDREPELLGAGATGD